MHVTTTQIAVVAGVQLVGHSFLDIQASLMQLSCHFYSDSSTLRRAR